MKKELIDFKFMLLESGFNVAQANLDHRNNVTWLLFEKYGRLGYVQMESFGYFSFASVNKPSKIYGTGTRILSEVWNPTIENAEYMVSKNWSNKNAELYSSLDEYAGYPINKILNYEVQKNWTEVISNLENN